MGGQGWGIINQERGERGAANLHSKPASFFSPTPFLQGGGGGGGGGCRKLMWESGWDPDSKHWFTTSFLQPLPV